MTLDPTTARRLLADLLDRQLDTEAAPLDLERLDAALTTGPALSADERRGLWRSPVARADYLRVKHRIDAELQQRWHERGLRLQLHAQAAAEDDSRELRYQDNDAGFSVTLFRQTAADMPWMILLRLTPELYQTLHPVSRVRLIDSGGYEWVCAKPDARGEISFGWYDLDQDPARRLRSHWLRLDLA